MAKAIGRYKEKLVSRYAVVTKKMERFIQVTCKDLNRNHHNRIVNVPRYPKDLSVGTTGRVVYRSSPTCGLLCFIENIQGGKA